MKVCSLAIRGWEHVWHSGMARCRNADGSAGVGSTLSFVLLLTSVCGL